MSIKQEHVYDFIVEQMFLGVDSPDLRKVVSKYTEKKKEIKMPEQTFVDPWDTGLPTGEVQKIDPNEDAWEFPPPPPMGDYNLKLLKLGQRSVNQKFFNPKEKQGVYYNASIEARVVDGPHKGSVVFPMASTRTPRGKNTNTCAGLILKLGGKLPDEPNDLNLVRTLGEVLKREPVLKAFVDWRAYSKLHERDVKRTMLEFPEKEKGVYQNVFVITGPDGVSKEEVRAQANVVHWYTEGESSIMASKGSNTSPPPPPEVETNLLAGATDEELASP